MSVFAHLTSAAVVPAFSCAVMSFLLPLAILISRDRLRSYRRGLVLALEKWLYQTDTPPITSFEAARIKYEMGPREGAAYDEGAVYGQTSKLSYVLPGLIYSSILALTFFMAMFLSRGDTFWDEQNFILSGAGEFGSVHDLNLYQRNSGALITAGFIGAFLFSLQYLIQRVRSYELSPISFLIATITILEGCLIVSVARHLVPSSSPTPWWGVLAFLMGYFPTFAVTWMVDRMRLRQLKAIEPSAYRARYVMPTDMIDGIDTLIKFRLMESGVRDVQGLATANPVLLYVETPYTLLTILDWMGQAQLILAVGSATAAALRAKGVRTIAQLVRFDVSDESRGAILRMIWPELAAPAGSAQHFATLCTVLGEDLHVQRLKAFLDIMTGLMAREHDAHHPLLKQVA